MVARFVYTTTVSFVLVFMYGRFMCLEFSRVPIEPLQTAYDWYSFNVIPTIGQVT